MKTLLSFLCCLSCFNFAHAQFKTLQETPANETVRILIQEGEIDLTEGSKGELVLKISSSQIQEIKEKGFATYRNFGAKGDGKTDDMDAIAATHAFANQFNLIVKAEDEATYYIGGKNRIAIVQTDTNFGKAAFIIDDTQVENRTSPIFKVTSNLESKKIEGVNSLKRNQKKIDLNLPQSSLITVTNANVKHYIRYGLNQDNGSSQTDIFLVDKNGNVNMDAPIIWDFDEITEITALPINEITLKITGGRFTTIANQEESAYNYYSRNISIKRSNVLVDGLEHKITGEGEHGAPYGGFLNISDCCFVTVQNTVLTGHKTYETIGRVGKPVSMGSYDLSVGRALNISFINCTQTNDINDRTYWGILGSNYCKNLLYDNCTLSRFDAHKGVANATIRNSTLGHMGINAIGSGTLTIENSTIQGWSLVNLRSDYGSTWQGDVVIRNCVFKPRGGTSNKLSLIGGAYTGQHDFGYICYMPEKITIENLYIDDSNPPYDYEGPTIFSNINPQMTDSTYTQTYPYVITEKVILNNVTTASGKTIRVSDNGFMFKDVEVVRE